VRAGVTAILGAAGGSYRPTPLVSAPSSSAFSDVAQKFGFFAAIFAFVVIMNLRRGYDPKRRRTRWYFDTSGYSSSSGGWSSRGSSGGGFSGGGGSFGGGGASGRW
jgi:uncharacterized protein